MVATALLPFADVLAAAIANRLAVIAGWVRSAGRAANRHPVNLLPGIHVSWLKTNSHQYRDL